MSTSVRSQAVAAVMDLLGANDSPATGGVFRARTEQFSVDQCQSFNVWPVEEKYSEEDDHESVTVTLTLRVQCLVTGESELDLAAEPLAVFAHQQIMADETLGKIVQSARLTQSKWSISPGQQDVAAFDLDFEVIYQISRGDPTVNQFYID